MYFFFFKQKTAYEMRISDWSSDVCSSDLTGVLAIGFLSAAVILAARPVQFENLLGGLDKFYRLHKWFGIAGASLGVIHWLIEILPRSFVRWGDRKSVV